MNKRSGALHITQKVDYGITLLVALAQKNHETASIRKIAQEKNLSFSFLQKIARQLQQSGLIKAERGKHGGYQIIKEPSEVYIKEIIESLEGPIAIVPCLKPSQKSLCKNAKHCELRSGFAKINLEIQEHLFSKSLVYFLE